MRLPHLHVCKAPLPTTYATCHPKSPSIDLPLAPAGRGATTLFAAEPIARDLLALCALPSCLDQMRRGKEDDHGEATATATMGRGGGAASSEEEEEEDFMSDSFLTTAEKLQEKHQEDTYSGRRRRALNAGSQSARVLSRVEREKQARAEGLGRSLFERRGSEADGGADTDGARKRRRREDDDGMDKNAGSPAPLHAGSKAMNMMRAMGFQHGQALGKHEPDATQDGATEVDERQPAAPPSSLAPLTEPLALDERWLGHKSRTGIGSMPPRAALALSRDISEAASREQKDSAALDASQAFRRRAGEEHKVRHWQALLVNARSTCEDLDRTLGIEVRADTATVAQQMQLTTTFQPPSTLRSGSTQRRCRSRGISCPYMSPASSSMRLPGWRERQKGTEGPSIAPRRLGSSVFSR